jgi:hypothetical protein
MIEFPNVVAAMDRPEIRDAFYELMFPRPVPKLAKRSRKPWPFMTPYQRYLAKQKKLRRMAMARQNGANKPYPVAP